jgi:hypothetical protein
MTRLLTFAFLLAGPLAVQAGIYKCQQGGQMVYSDKPCPQAKTIDTTNAAQPTASDYYLAKARSLRERAAIDKIEIDRQRDEQQRQRCQKMARDHNWTRTTAAKYANDPWWQNRAADSSVRLGDECGKYLTPAGLGHHP